MKTHISLNVSSISESIEFYKKMFGVEPFKVRPGYAKFDIENPPLNLTMNQTTFAKGGSLSHLGLQAETSEDVLKIGKRWAESGLTTLDEMHTDCCYALQDKTWISDPDGNQWEVFVVLGDTPGTAASDATCCIQSSIGVQDKTVNSCC